MLLSVDWDYYSGSVEHTFDSPLWGTPDREVDRADAWRVRARQRNPGASSWEPLFADFPLYGEPRELLKYEGVPVFVAWSHASAWEWLERFPARDVMNFDSHHDLYSRSGDPVRVRPGNWAGLGLQRGLIERYTCIYPGWHEHVRVAEGFDLERTEDEVKAALPRELVARARFGRGESLPAATEVEALLIVQSPAWTNPAHDDVLLEITGALTGRPLSALWMRDWAS